MFKRYIFLIFSVAAIAAFLGCHAGGHAPLINSFDSQIVERVATVTNGRFPDISFPSGAAIRCTTDNILKDGVKITAEEEKILVEYDYSTKAPVYYYLYKISAVLPSAKALDGDVIVSTIEQPISITLPNNISDSGNCFVGLRASENEPWLYSLINDSNANIASLRLAKRADKTCSFNLFRLGQQFRLFVFDSFKEDEAVVSSVTSFTDDKITIKDDKYAEDLNLKVRIIGEKLDQIKVDSLKARITYRSDNLSPVQLKANGSIVSQTDSSDKAVSGAYAHSFVVSNIKVESQMSSEAVLSLVINLKDIKLADFPTKFLIEFYSDGKAENTLPFIYTEAFRFETKEQQDDPPTPLETYTIILELNGGTLDETTIEYTAETEDFNIPTPTRTNYTFLGWTGYNGDTPEKTVTILKGSTGDRTYKANWQQNAPDEYTLTLVAGKGIASVDETKAYKAGESITLNCTLKDGYEFDKWVDSNANEVESPFVMLSEDVTLTATAKTITYNLNYFIDGGQLDNDNPKTYTVETEDITLCDPTKEGYTFLGWTSSEVTVPLTPMTIKQGTTGEKTFTANWSPKSYSITYSNIDGCTFETANPVTYNIESDEITLSKPTKANDTFTGWTYEGQTTPQLEVKIAKGSTGDKVFNANWETFAVVSLKSAKTDFPIDGQIQLEFDKDIAWQDSYKDCITITPITPTTPTTPITTNSISYSNKLLKLTLSENLKYSSQYQIAVAGIENLCDKNMTFTTVALTVTPQISSQTSDITKVNGVDRLVLQPTFTINYGKKVLNQTAAKTSIKLNDAALPNSSTLVFDEDGEIATLTFTADLDVFTDYTLSLEEFADDDNATINAKTLSFKTVQPDDITGEGTSNNPYLIYTQAHLNKLREDAYLQTGKYFKQMDNIVMTGNWSPIGSYDNPFYGFYDGNNLKIIDLTIQATKRDVGLFSAISSNNSCEIKNLKLENVSIIVDRGEHNIGALAGYIKNANVTNVHVIGEVNIKGVSIIGGLAGECIDVNILRCSVDSPNGLIGYEDIGLIIGGLIGSITYGTIYESYVSIKIQGNSQIGGLFGFCDVCSIENSYSDSTLIVVGNSPSEIGGLVGRMGKNDSSFNNCYAKVTYGSESVSYGNCLAGYVDEDAQHLFNNSKNNFAWRAELTDINSTKILYKHGDTVSPDDGKDSDRNNYFSNGYPSSDFTGANWDAWDPEIWDNTTPGSWPKLKWQSGN